MRGIVFDAWLRLVAGWDLRSREADQWTSLAVMALMVAIAFVSAVLFGGAFEHFWLATLVSAVWLGVYLLGLWEDGGRALAEED